MKQRERERDRYFAPLHDNPLQEQEPMISPVYSEEGEKRKTQSSLFYLKKRIRKKEREGRRTTPSVACIHNENVEKDKYTTIL